jgi:hypothetical protein
MNGKRTAVALLVMALGSVALGAEAQPKGAPKAAPVLGDKARALYEEGRALATKQKWPEAYASYFAAWSLLRHYQIASNLGNAELKLGKYRDAAEHLWFAISEQTKTGEDASVVAGDRKLLEEALRHVGRIDVTVSVEGAEVLLGDTLLGTSPLDAPLFVEAGTFTVHARKAGLVAAKVEMVIGKGEQKRADLLLGKEGAVPVPSASGSAAAPAPAPSGSAAVPVAEPWPLWPVYAGAGASAVALVAGGVFIGLGASASSDADALRDAGKASGRSCEGGCADIVSAYEDADGSYNTAVPLLIAGGVFAGGTVAYALLFAGEPRATAWTWIMPQVGQDGVGFEARGTF